MSQKIAIPTTRGTLEPHFGHCSHFTFVDVTEGLVSGQEIVEAPPHQPGFLPGWLAQRGVTDVIAGGMGDRALHLLEKNGIRVHAGAPSLSTQEIVRTFLNGTLELSPEQCDHHHHDGEHHHGDHHHQH